MCLSGHEGLWAIWMARTKQNSSSGSPVHYSWNIIARSLATDTPDTT